jgi:serine/threonine protein kinase
MQGHYNSDVSPPVSPGEIIAGKYRVERVIGTGGMGVVVRAIHLKLELPIAVKFMSAGLRTNELGIRRFVREARAMAGIRSEHVVRVIDADSLSDGTPYIVMEYLEGSDLDHVLRDRLIVPVAEAISYMLQAGEAIAEAHAAGIVHRDLKPANLFRCRRADGSALIKVLDFGVSKLLPKPGITTSNAWVTRPRATIGSPVYIAPEQLRSPHDVDSRADLWALGAILYELVTGQPPFIAETIPQICANILNHPLLPPSRRRPQVPLGFDDAVARILTKEPGRRVQTIAEWAKLLAPFAPTSALISVDRITAIGRHPPRQTRVGRHWPKERRRRRVVLAALLGCAAAILVVGSFAKLHATTALEAPPLTSAQPARERVGPPAEPLPSAQPQAPEPAPPASVVTAPPFETPTAMIRAQRHFAIPALTARNLSATADARAPSSVAAPGAPVSAQPAHVVPNTVGFGGLD